MNARKRATNMAKTKTKNKNKTYVCGKGGGLDDDLGWVDNLLAGGRFDIYLDLEGGSAEKNLLGKTNQHLKQSIILPQTKYQRGRRIGFPRKRGNSAGESKRLPLRLTNK